MAEEQQQPNACDTCGVLAVVMIGMSGTRGDKWWLCARCWREGRHGVAMPTTVKGRP